MIERRQSVQRQHPKGRRKPRPQNRPLIRGHNKRRPRVRRPPANIQRIRKHRDPGLQREHRRQSHQPAHQRDQRHLVAMEADGLRRLFHRIRRVAIHAPPAVLRAPAARRAPGRWGYRIRPAGRKFLRVQAYQSPAFAVALGVIFAPGSIMRISFIGIMGRKRTNSRNSAVNNPSVPTYVM